MYYLSNGEKCQDIIRKSAIFGNYTIAIFEQGKGFRVSLIDNRNLCEISMKFKFDYDDALSIAMNTFSKIQKSPAGNKPIGAN